MRSIDNNSSKSLDCKDLIFLRVMQEKDLLIHRRPFVPRCSVCCRLNHNTVDCLTKRNVSFILAKESSAITNTVSGRRKKSSLKNRFNWKNDY
jgi:hypothetical protein